MKTFMKIVIAMCMIPMCSYTQVLECHCYEEIPDKRIDKAYEREINEWTTNYEFSQCADKFLKLWAAQAEYEYVRLYYTMNTDGRVALKKAYASFLKMIDDKRKLLYESVDVQMYGRETYIGMGLGFMQLYRSQAIEFFELWCKLDSEQSNYNLTVKRLATRQEAVLLNGKHKNEIQMKW